MPTYRCFYPDERAYVIEHIDELVLKPANESGGYGILIGDRATRSELDAHIALIEADPRNWVAQPILSLSTVPTLCDGVIDTAPRRPAAVHPQRGDQLRHRRRADPCRAAQGLADRQLVAGRRQQGHLDRRGAIDAAVAGRRQPVLGRPLPRAGGGHGAHRAQLTPTSSSTCRPVVLSSWEPLLAVAGDRVDFDARTTLSTRCTIVRFLVADTPNPGSVITCIANARENLRTTREVLPRDAWQAVNDLHLYIGANAASGVERRSRARFLSRVIAECQRSTAR